MNLETKQALKESIEHWERLASGDRHPGEGIGGGHCSLCAKFDLGVPIILKCDGCPVSAFSGKPKCEETPYTGANCAGWKHGLDSDEFKAAAQLELEFLRSLLPKDDRDAP